MNKNFQAFKIKDSIDKMEKLGGELAKHTILLITRSNDPSINHWRTEIISWLDKLRSYNNLKIKTKKLSITTISGVLYERFLGEDSDIIYIYQCAIGDEDNLPPNKVDTSNLNIEFYRISLGAIYDEYIKYIDGSISRSEIIQKISKFYLYPGK